MTTYIVAGHGRALDIACETADECGLESVRIQLSTLDHYNFDLAPIAEYCAVDTRVFIALDHRAVNYARHKLIADVRLAGYKGFNLISPRAHLCSGINLKSNVYIGAGSNIGSACVIGLGCWLERQVLIGENGRLGACVTMLSGTRLGDSTTIGTGSTLGEGACSLPGTKVGRHCEWLLPQVLPMSLEDRTFYDPQMPTGARVLKN